MLVEVANMRADGTRFPVEVHTAGFDYKGKKVMVAVARDLSNRWQAETRYRLLLESIDVGVILFDRDMHVISANPAAHRAIGAEPGQSVHTLLQPENWNIVDARGRPLSFHEWPTTQALERAQVVSNTIVGLYYVPKRRMSWISVTTVPVSKPTALRRNMCSRCSAMSPRSSATTSCSTAPKASRISAAGGMGPRPPAPVSHPRSAAHPRSRPRTGDHGRHARRRFYGPD